MQSTYEAGRTTPAADLEAAIRDGDVEFLDGALANPALRVQHLQAMLRARAVTPELIRRVSRSPVWTKFNRVRRALVLHPKTPRPLAMGLLPTLRWADLLQVGSTPGLPVALRSGALKILGLRLPELSLGEKITLARQAPPELLALLLGESYPDIIRAALQNRHTRPDQVAALVEDGTTAADILGIVATAPRFTERESIRAAVVAHPNTPVPAALGLIMRMQVPELERLLDGRPIPVLIRVAATRRLTEERGGSRGVSD